jgi:putative FmdB family regulatory protein
MPIYLYECASCGVRFERLQRMSDEPLTVCPECKGPIHRVIQPVGIIFKGSGFYVTDNRQRSSSTLGAPKDSKTKDNADAPAADGATSEAKKETAAPKEESST